MNFLILLLAIVPIYASSDAFEDLLAEELQDAIIEHVREKRQAQRGNYRPISQAPAQIQQLLNAQQARDPLVHLPAQSPPRFAGGQQSQPQYQNQGQVSQYRPNVQYGSAPQQPTYKSIPVRPAQYKKPVVPQQSAYRPAGGNYPQQQQQPKFLGSYSPGAAAQPQYSKQLPPQLQQLLQVQANLPNTIPQALNGPRKPY